MKYDCDKREDRLSNWHRWFAWHPVYIGKNDCRWWEWVERKGKLEYTEAGMGFSWFFQHRPASN